jgi:hypothetical protein
MTREHLISFQQLSTHYQIEMSFFYDLIEFGLIENNTLENVSYVHLDSLNDLEKIIRMHQQLEINLEGIDVVFNLLKKMDELQTELISLRNRLSHFEK